MIEEENVAKCALFCAHRNRIPREPKARCKELNEGHACDMTLAELQKYERDHNIPDFSPEQLQAIKRLKKGEQ